MIPPALLAMIVFTFVMIMNKLLLLANMLIQKGVGLEQIVRLLIYIFPSIITLTIPIAALLGIIIGLNRLSCDSEIIAMRAGGISLYSLAKPVMIFAIFMWIVNSYIMIYSLPWGNSKLLELQFKITMSQAILKDAKPRIFDESLPNQVFYISDISPDAKRWKKVFICQNQRIDKPSIILAEEGQPIYDKKSGKIALRLFNGTLYETNLLRPKKSNRVSSFKELNILLSEGIKITDQDISLQKDERSMTLKELWHNIQRKKGRNYLKANIINKTNYPTSFFVKLIMYNNKSNDQILLNFKKTLKPKKSTQLDIPYYLPSSEPNSFLKIKLTRLNKQDKKREVIFIKDWAIDELKDKSFIQEGLIAAEKIEDSAIRINKLNLGKIDQPSNYQSLMVELHKKFSIPFACLIFGILGLPLGLTFRRAGKSAGYVLGLIIFLLYYAFLMNGEVMADKGKIPPFLGMWAANIFFGIIGIGMCLQKGRATQILSKLIYFLKRRTRRIFEIFKSRPKQKRVKAIQVEAKPRVIIRFPRLSWKFPNILDRYIIITFFKIYLLVFIAIYSVFALVDFVDINEEIERRQLPYTLMAEYFKFKFPQVLSYIIPITTLMSAMIALSILSKYREIVAIKAAGISIYRVFLPLIIIAAIFSGLAFLLKDNILPYSNKRLSQITQTIKGGPVQTYYQRGSRWVFGRRNRIFHYFAQDLQQKVINRLSVFDFNPSLFTLKRQVFVQQVKWDSSEDRWMEFNNGWSQSFDSQGVPHLKLFDQKQNINIEEKPSYFRQEIKLPDEMNYGELRGYIRELKGRGYNTLEPEVDLHWKISFPLLSLIFTLIGLSFSLRIEKKGALTGIFISIALVVIYWNFMVLFQNLGYAGFLPPLLAAWVPNIIFGIGGLYLILAVKT